MKNIGVTWIQPLGEDDEREDRRENAHNRYREDLIRARDIRWSSNPDPWEQLLTEIDSNILVSDTLRGARNSPHDELAIDAFDFRLANLCIKTGQEMPVFPTEGNCRAKMSRRRKWLADWLERRANPPPEKNVPLSELGANQPPKRRGRKKANYNTVQAEANLAAEWVRRRDAGECKRDFAKEKGTNVADFDRLLERVAKRKRQK